MDPKLIKSFKELGDLYKILAIEPTDDKKQIKRAYKDQAKIHHPDKSKAIDAKENYIKLKHAYDILMDTDLKSQFDKYRLGQKQHVERSSNLNRERKKFADDLMSREKGHQEAQDVDQNRRKTKEEMQREESKKMKKEWEEEEQKRKEQLEKKKAEKIESKEFTMIKVKWPKGQKMIYTEDIFKIIFGKYGAIKSAMVLPNDRKALIEYQYRHSAEKAYADNKKEEKEKQGFDDGLKVSLLVKNKDKEQDGAERKKNDLNLSSGNIGKISNILNRDSKIAAGTKEQEAQRSYERQRMIDEILAQAGLNT